MNKTQKAALDLIRADSRFLYSLISVTKNEAIIDGNFFMMSQPYIGVFVDGAEKWASKMKLSPPEFTGDQREYYTALRQGHKIFELPCDSLTLELTEALEESDRYFFNKRSLLEKLIGYYNVGTDLFDGRFCGNTLLCAIYSPVKLTEAEKHQEWLKNVGIIGGKIAAYFDCKEQPLLKTKPSARLTYKDYHFYNNCPLKEKNSLGLLLFSILCSINYTIYLIEKLYVDEIPQKFKFAYLQYYYLCGFIAELNDSYGASFDLNDSLKSRELRNCLAHYGLGQFMSDDDVILSDPLKGLTNRAFGLDYPVAKKQLFSYLNDLACQIIARIF